MKNYKTFNFQRTDSSKNIFNNNIETSKNEETDSLKNQNEFYSIKTIQNNFINKSSIYHNNSNINKLNDNNEINLYNYKDFEKRIYNLEKKVND